MKRIFIFLDHYFYMIQYKLDTFCLVQINKNKYISSFHFVKNISHSKFAASKILTIVIQNYYEPHDYKIRYRN